MDRQHDRHRETTGVSAQNVDEPRCNYVLGCICASTAVDANSLTRGALHGSGAEACVRPHVLLLFAPLFATTDSSTVCLARRTAAPVALAGTRAARST